MNIADIERANKLRAYAALAGAPVFFVFLFLTQSESLPFPEGSVVFLLVFFLTLFAFFELYLRRHIVAKCPNCSTRVVNVQKKTIEAEGLYCSRCGTNLVPPNS
jgi:hypothetical protein